MCRQKDCQEDFFLKLREIVSYYFVVVVLFVHSFFFFNFYLLLTVPSLHCCKWTPSWTGHCCLVAVWELLVAVTSLVEPRFWGAWASVGLQ